METKKILEAQKSLEQYLEKNYVKEGNQGYWPYLANGQSSSEATAWAGLALRKNKTIAESTARFFVSTQLKDGGWSTTKNSGSSDWATGPVLLCYRSLLKEHFEFSNQNDFKDCLEKAMSKISESRVSFYPVVARLLRFMIDGPRALQYARGWPWDPGCYHWVEPTTYCLLSLKVPGMPSQDLYKEVTRYADKFLIEHACKGGGWNHGSFLSLGAYLPPYRLTTAESLLALQDNKDHKVIKEALAYLQSQTNSDSSSISLAWSILALNAYGKDCQKELNFLLDRQTRSNKEGLGNGPNLMSTAISHLAYSAMLGENVLQFEHI